MKTPSTDLHQLIHRLTQPERRYFKQYARRHTIGNINNYEQLFDLLSKQNIYDEAALKQAWRQLGHTKGFAVHKRQLYLQVLQSLHEFHKATDIEEEAREGLHQVSILLNMGLTDQAEKHLFRTTKLIAKNELTELLPATYRLRRKIWSKQYYKGVPAERLKNLEQEETQTYKLLENLNRVRALADRMAQLHYTRVSARADATTKEADRLLDEIQKALQTAHVNYTMMIDSTQAMATGAFLKGDYQTAWHYNRELLNLMEKSWLANLYPDRYFSTLNNFLIDSLQLGQTKEARQGLKRLRSLGYNPAFRKLANLEMNIFRLGYQLELNLCLNEGRFEEAPRLATAIDEGLKRFGDEIVVHNRISFQYLLAYLQFGQGEFDPAIDRLNTIIDDRDDQPVQEIQSFARLLHLLAHYELGNYRLLESLIESTYRYQKRRKQLYETETQVLNFLRKANYNEEKHIREALLRAFASRLEPLEQNPKEARAFNYFHFTAWVESKLTGKPFAEVFRERRG